MPRLVALRLFNYPSGTRRRLQPGEAFEAGRDAKALCDLGLARMATDYEQERQQEPISEGSAAPGEAPQGLSSLRDQYLNIAGRAPDMRWGTQRLRQEIETRRLEYQRRDMRAEK